MPHQCTDCGTVYDDGSREMLGGCEDCGGTTFAYTKDPDPALAAEPADGPGSADGTPASDDEDPAQTRARSGIVEAADDGPSTDGEPSGEDPGTTSPSPADHPSASGGDAGDGVVPTQDVDEVREELMAQFESIKIVEPGSYELNLMNLYDRDEKIIALQEDGRYQVSLPSALDD